ncbi:MAG: ribose 5-phosphate isomerase B [Candidatus Gastranaerophilales bacterium]|nr:ribose 5-phosphate isomerase B [Candidatus Gastranaerophilales bacterium]
MKKIAIGSDHGGFELKEYIIKFIKDSGYKYKDFGIYEKQPTDYPIIAKEVAQNIVDGNFNLGILICGSGLGMAITANKIKGIRAVTCSDIYSAKMSRMHNNANILTLGERVLGKDLALEIVNIWLNTEFEGGRHLNRINMIE